MKKILAVALAFCTFSLSLFAQDDEIRRPAIGLSFFFNDFVTPERIKASNVAGVLRDGKWANLSEMKGGLALHYFKGLRKHVDFAGTLAGSFLRYPMPGKNFTNDNFLLEADASLNLKMLTEKHAVQPYLSVGIGASRYQNYWGAIMPFGMGLKVNLFNETHLFSNFQYRVPVTTETTAHHFFYNFGVAGALGKKKAPVVIPPPPPPPLPPADTDGDGIIDPDDKCPNVKGVAKYQGCPVPDTDKDGINDDNDKCVTVPGVARYQGCPIPDTDNDGLNDEDDKCPTLPGVARYQGCPIPDGDGDGINDEEDKCPRTAGPASNFGCPVIGIKFHEVVFKTGSAVLLPKGKAVLDTVVRYLNTNEGVNVTIDGHTDNTGTDKINNPLSLKRAEAVKAYIASKGVDASRMITAGFGSKKPVADNKTAAGRQKNRRIEIKIKE